MYNITGNATIELTDVATNARDVIYEKNMVTNMLSNMYESLINIHQVSSSHSQYVRDVASSILDQNISPINYFGKDKNGIMVFSEPVYENPDVFMTNQIPLATAGSVYDNSDSTRGTMNAKETTEIVSVSDSSRVVGVKFVWDFNTSQANGVISSVSICDISSGNKIGMPWQPAPKTITIDSQSAKLGFEEHVPQSMNISNISKNGHVYTANDTGYVKETICDITIGFDTPYTPSTEGSTEYQIAGYSGFINLHIHDNISEISLLGKNDATDMWEIITVGMDTNVIKANTPIPNITFEPKNFGRVGNFIIFQPVGKYNTSVPWTIHVFNITSGLFEDPISVTVPAGEHGYNKNIGGLSTINEYQAGDNTFISSVDGIRLSEHSYRDGVSHTLFYDISGTITPIANNAGVITMNVGDSFHIRKTHSATTNLISVSPGFHNMALFTINNLETPINKTNANTMKITYELRWGE